jgi:hypothetical protein
MSRKRCVWCDLLIAWRESEVFDCFIWASVEIDCIESGPPNLRPFVRIFNKLIVQQQINLLDDKRRRTWRSYWSLFTTSKSTMDRQMPPRWERPNPAGPVGPSRRDSDPPSIWVAFQSNTGNRKLDHRPCSRECEVTWSPNRAYDQWCVRDHQWSHHGESPSPPRRNDGWVFTHQMSSAMELPL